MDNRETIMKGLKPMFEKARKEGLNFSLKPSLMGPMTLTPDEFEACLNKNQYVWGAVNWELVKPKPEKEKPQSSIGDQPAFPSTEIQTGKEGQEYEHLNPGMTIRQWYKGQALKRVPFGRLNRDDIVPEASKIADAMIREDEEHAKKAK